MQRTRVMSTSATVDVVLELATLLRCGLDRKSTQIVMALIDSGVNPAALAAAILELRRQAAAAAAGTPPLDASARGAAREPR